MGFQLKALAVTLLLFVFNSAIGQTVAGYSTEIIKWSPGSAEYKSQQSIASDGTNDYYLTFDLKGQGYKYAIEKRGRDMKLLKKAAFLNASKYDGFSDEKFVNELAILGAEVSEDQTVLTVFILKKYLGIFYHLAYSNNMFVEGADAKLIVAKYNTSTLELLEMKELTELEGHTETDKFGVSSITTIDQDDFWVGTAAFKDGSFSYKRFDGSGKLIASKSFKSPEGTPVVIDEMAHTANGYVVLLARSKKYGSMLFTFNPSDDSDISVSGLGLKEGYVYSNPYLVQVGDNSVCLVGIYAEKNLESSLGYYVSEISPDRNSTKKLQHVPYDDAMLSFLQQGSQGKKVKNGEAQKLEITDVLVEGEKLHIVSNVTWEVYSSSGSVRYNSCESVVSRLDMSSSSLKLKSTGIMQRYMGMGFATKKHIAWVDNGTVYFLRHEKADNINETEFKELSLTTDYNRPEIGIALSVIPEDGAAKSYIVPGTLGKKATFTNVRSWPGTTDMAFILLSGNPFGPVDKPDAYILRLKGK